MSVRNRTRRHPRFAVVAAASLLAVGLAGCTGGDSSTPETSPTESATSQSAPTEATATEPSASTGASSPAPTAPTAAGPTADPGGRPGAARGDGYSFTPPKGWVDSTQSAQGINAGADLGWSAPVADGRFTNNLNVTVIDAGIDDPTATQLRVISAQTEKELRTLVPNLTVNPSTEVAGAVSLDHEGMASVTGTNYYLHQVIPFNDGNAYVISFSFSPAASEAERDRLMARVLSSWRWE